MCLLLDDFKNLLMLASEDCATITAAIVATINRTAAFGVGQMGAVPA
jgi:hypothetical protein